MRGIFGRPYGSVAIALEKGAAKMSLAAGLCDSCRHQQIVRNTRGSVFSLCRRSRDEPERFPRYPRIPVTACAGYEGAEPDARPWSPPPERSGLPET